MFLFHHKLSQEKNPKLPAKNIEKDEAGHTTPCQVSTWKKTKETRLLQAGLGICCGLEWTIITTEWYTVLRLTTGTRGGHVGGT